MAEHTHTEPSSEADERTEERTTTVQTASNGVTAVIVIVLVLLALVAFMYFSGTDLFANQVDVDVVGPDEDAGGSQEQPQELPEGGSNFEFDQSGVGGFL